MAKKLKKTQETAIDLKKKLDKDVLNDERNLKRKLRVQLTIGVLLGFGIASIIAFCNLGLIKLHYYLIAIIIVISVIVLLLIYFLYFFKDEIIYKVFKVGSASYEELFQTFSTDSKKLIKSAVEEKTYENINPIIETFERSGKQLIAYISYQRTKRFLFNVFISLILGFIGYVGTVVLIEQNELLKNQNKKISQQTALQEAERRSSYMFLMGNLFDEMNRELREDYNKKGVRDFSSQLIGQIAALSAGLKPYKSLQGDSLSEKFSPERGQLLLMLVNSDLSDSTYQKIYSVTDFSFADLSGYILSNANLEGAHLFNANFYGTNLFNANLKNACLLYTSPSPRDATLSRMPSSA